MDKRWMIGCRAEPDQAVMFPSAAAGVHGLGHITLPCTDLCPSLRP